MPLSIIKSNKIIKQKYSNHEWEIFRKLSPRISLYQLFKHNTQRCFGGLGIAQRVSLSLHPILNPRTFGRHGKNTPTNHRVLSASFGITTLLPQSALSEPNIQKRARFGTLILKFTEILWLYHIRPK